MLKFLKFVVLLIVCHGYGQISQTDAEKSAYGILNRLLPQHTASFTFTEIAADNGKDVFEIENGKDEKITKRNYQIFKTNCAVPGFTAYHEKMQTFLMWFIESASYIDIDDDLTFLKDGKSLVKPNATLSVGESLDLNLGFASSRALSFLKSVS